MSRAFKSHAIVNVKVYVQRRRIGSIGIVLLLLHFLNTGRSIILLHIIGRLGSVLSLWQQCFYYIPVLASISLFNVQLW